MGLFGSSPSYNANASQPYADAIRGYTTSLGGDYNSARNQNAGLNADNMAAYQNYAKYLSTNPATSQYNATQVANATQGMAESGERAKANTIADLASRGISADSGIGAGALANINEGMANNNAQIQSQVGQNNIQRYASNLATLSGLTNNMASNSFNQANTLGSEYANANQNLFSDSDRMAQEQYQSDQNKAAGQNALFSSIGGALISAFNPAAGGVFSQAASSASPSSAGLIPPSSDGIIASQQQKPGMGYGQWQY